MAFRGVTGEIVEVRRSDGELCILWRIPRFLSLPSEGYGYYYDSPRFSFLEGSLFMRVFPNSSLRVSLDLQRDGKVASSTKTVNVTVGVRGSGGLELRREGDWKISNSSYWGLKEFCSRFELSGKKYTLMPDDVLVIMCELRIPGTAGGSLSYQDNSVQRDNECPQPIPRTCSCQSRDKQAVEELQSSLHSLLESEEDCDVTIKVRGKEFRAHRSILRARSPVFRAMFAHDMVENQRGLVTMEDCDPDTFPQFLEHIYTGSIGMISAKNVISLFINSDKYDLKMLKKECAQFMKENMTVASFCDVITLAVKHNEKELIERATEFFCGNSLDIVKSVEWQVFLAENPTVGNELLVKLLSKR